MFRGLYTAGSAMITNTRTIDILSNNMANANTIAFKRDIVLSESFEDTLLSRINGSDDYPNRTNRSAEVKQSGKEVSIDLTNGYLQTKVPYGMSYSNSAKLTVDSEGYLSTYYKDSEGKILTDHGYRVYGSNGPIKVGDGDYEIDKNGNVVVDGETLDNIFTPIAKNIIGTMNSGIKIERVVTNFEQGQLRATSNPLDFAIRGDGFFEIDTPDGIRYTRDGRFKINAESELVTTEGFNVVGFNGNIVLDSDNVSVNKFGEIIMDGETKDKFKMLDIENKYDLRKQGAGYFYLEDGIEVKELPFEGAVEQGHIEDTNVSSMKEMIELLSAYRNYETSQRVVKAYDETIAKAANEIGRI